VKKVLVHLLILSAVAFAIYPILWVVMLATPWWRLQGWTADESAVHLTEAPDVLAGHRCLRLADHPGSQVDQNGGVSGATFPFWGSSTGATYSCLKAMTAWSGVSDLPGRRRALGLFGPAHSGVMLLARSMPPDNPLSGP